MEAAYQKNVVGVIREEIWQVNLGCAVMLCMATSPLPHAAVQASSMLHTYVVHTGRGDVSSLNTPDTVRH